MSKNQKIIFLLIFSFTLFFRLAVAAHFNGYSFDETVSISIAQKPLSEMWGYLRWEMHPPLHYYFLHFWMNIFGTAEVSLRFSSLFISLLTFFALYALGKELFSSVEPALSACFVYAIFPVLNFYAIWVRMYGLLFLFSTLSFWLFLKMLKAAKTRKPGASCLALYIFCTICALFTHLTALLIPVIQATYCFYLYLRKKIAFKKIIYYFLFPNIFILCLYYFWFTNFLLRPFHFITAEAWYFYDRPQAFFFLTKTLSFFVDVENLYLSFFTLIVIFIISCLTLVEFKKVEKQKFKINFVLGQKQIFIWLIFLISFLSIYSAKLYQSRYYILPNLGIILIFAYGLSRYYLKLSIKIFLMASLFLAVLPSLIYILKIPDNNWQNVNRFIAENEKNNDKIITASYNDLLFVNLYYKGSLSADALIDENKKEENVLLTVVKTNYYPSANINNLNLLKKLSGANQRIFLIYTKGAYYYSQFLVQKWFLSNGWKIKKELTAPPVNSPYDMPYVWLLEKV